MYKLSSVLIDAHKDFLFNSYLKSVYKNANLDILLKIFQKNVLNNAPLAISDKVFQTDVSNNALFKVMLIRKLDIVQKNALKIFSKFLGNVNKIALKASFQTTYINSVDNQDSKLDVNTKRLICNKFAC